MKHAFSLVELSIVLVILGLLTGGILTGQSLIRAAELRSVTTEFQRYQTAVQTFRDKYRAIPGDMRNAQTFWGIQDSTPVTCITSPSTSALTCNGDGDGRILESAPGSNELFRFWQHLANAGLTEGSFTGVAGAGGTVHAVPQLNVPSTRVGNGGFTIRGHGTITGHGNWFDGAYGNTFMVGASNTNSYTSSPLFKPEEVWNIDQKIDDGRPGFGNIRVWKPAFQVGCATTNISDTAEYNFADTANRCSILIITGF